MPKDLRERSRTLWRLRSLARLLDSSIRIPVLGYRIGLDPIVGLIPGVGDALMLLPSAYIVFEAYRLGVPRRTVVRMALNVGVETLFGAVPFLGDLFDATFKANIRNLHLLERHVGQLGDAPLKQPSDRGVMLFLGVVLLLILAGAIFALWVGSWLFQGLLNVL